MNPPSIVRSSLLIHLGHYQPEVEDTAEAYITLARNSSVTGQAMQIGRCPLGYSMYAVTNFVDSGFVINY